MATPAPAALTGADPTFAELLAARPQLTAHAMDGLLLEGVPLAAIAAAHGTPTWVYSAGTLRRRASTLLGALAAAGLDASVHFAVKANPSLSVLRVLRDAGCGADVVSVGELAAARAAGIDPGAIVFSGVGKTDAELHAALDAGILQINLESAEEAERLSALTAGRTARVALRVNPDVDAGTHAKISTGRRGDKFGVAIAEAPALYARLAALPGLVPVGIAVHIGSQITAGMAPFRAAYARVAELARALLAAGLPVERIDCGGGLGIPYRNEPAPRPDALAGAIAATLGPLGLPVMLEPGRWLVGPAGVLLAAVTLEKHSGDRRFVVLDAAMNDLTRPAMYDSWHGILPVAAADLAAAVTPADVVGPVCETSDTFARDRLLPPLRPGALAAFLDAGAYGAAMSSTYNQRPLAAEVLVDGEHFALIRERQPPEALLERQRLPGWLAP